MSASRSTRPTRSRRPTPVCVPRAWPPRPRTTWPVATRCRTRSGSTTPTVRRGRSTRFSATSRCPVESCAPSIRRQARPVARPPRTRRPPPRAAEVTTPLARRLVAEFLGTAFLLVAVIGSGIAAQRLSPGDTGLQLLENAMATGAALVALILAFGSVSGAHFNPLVTLADRLFRGVTSREARGYLVVQVA